MVTVSSDILVADEAWVALASLHRRSPDRNGFSAKEILESATNEGAYPELRPGLSPHIHLHNVANRAPNSARYRMFYRLSNGEYRLFRPGDDYHPDRKGKTAPKREELPQRYHPLLDWYENEYSNCAHSSDDQDDPVLQMWGVGKELWTDEDGDTFIARERAAMHREMELRSSSEPESAPDSETLADRVWKRIATHQGSEFRTAKNLLFTYSVEGNAIWFYRNGQRIEQRLSRGELEKAIAKCPVDKVTDLADRRDPSYLFGLLIDSRIRGKDW